MRWARGVLKTRPAASGSPWRVAARSGARRRVAPRGGRLLPASGRRRASAGERGRGVGLGWRGGCWAKAKRGSRPARCGARGGFAGPACGAGPKARRRPAKEKNSFSFIFQELFKGQLLNIILSKKMTSFENVPKMKVV